MWRCFFFFFFFSSRRRHTRCGRDWSSDVCSSDLSAAALVAAQAGSRVLLIERGEYAGSKNVSGAAFYAPQVLEALLPDFWRFAPVERHLIRRVISFVSPES